MEPIFAAKSHHPPTLHRFSLEENKLTVKQTKKKRKVTDESHVTAVATKDRQKQRKSCQEARVNQNFSTKKIRRKIFCSDNRITNENDERPRPWMMRQILHPFIVVLSNHQSHVVGKFPLSLSLSLCFYLFLVVDRSPLTIFLLRTDINLLMIVSTFGFFLSFLNRKFVLLRFDSLIL